MVVVTSVAMYLVQPTPEKVAIATTISASTGPAGWIIGGGILVVVAIIGFLAWLFGSAANKNQNSHNMKYVNGAKQTTKAAVHSVTNDQKNKLLDNALEIKSFHVSCKSDHPSNANKWNAIGIVLFEYDGKGDFVINNIHCKSGYIVLKTDTNLSTNGKTYHAALFKKTFGKSHKKLDKTLVAGGFAIQNGKCAFNSGTFNCGNSKEDKYHFGTRTMNPLVQHYIEISVKNWIQSRKQNTYIKDSTQLKQDIMCLHPEYKGGSDHQ